MVSYIALLRKEKESDFGVDFPDFPGCITAGRTLEEAHRRASEVLQFHIRGMREDGDPIPEPSSLDRVMADPANADAVPFLVTVPDTKTKRVNITVPEHELQAIDECAQRHNLSRSAFLLEAAKRAIAGEQMSGD
ncbi:MAG: type II toxin-antitoxin system HicB family antitoxin [Desulfomonile tiedjei]|nr:type II toxin-antitoxin system HicB family antitoxin [Desulfomonile tiedjei]